MGRLAAIATILAGLAWMARLLSEVGVAFELGPFTFASAAFPASLALLALGAGGSLAIGTWGRSRAAVAGSAALALGGALAAVSYVGNTVLLAVGLWLVLGGSIAVGWAVRRIGRAERDRGITGTATALVVSAGGLVLLALLSSRGPVGIVDIDGSSSIGKVFALDQLAFGGSWAWLGWRAFERPSLPIESRSRPVERRTWVAAIAGATVIALLVLGGASAYWAGSLRGPAGPPVDARFEGVGGEEHYPIVFPGGDAQFEWDIRDCGSQVGRHAVLAMDLFRQYDDDHPPDPQPPSFLGGAPRRIGLPGRLIVGQEYGAGGTVSGSTSLQVDGGLWSLHIEMPGSCHWRIAIRSD